jgi:uncharacterized protein
MTDIRVREIPILPLPNNVLFPRTILPLRIFEPRYQQLVRDVLAEDGEMGVVLLEPGWEPDYYDSPAVFGIGGMGAISEHETQDDRHIRILLQGLTRFRLEEFVQQKPYRVARIEMVKDKVPTDSREIRRMSRLLLRYFREMAEAAESERTSLRVLDKLDFHTLVNSVCASLNFSIYEKQRLLEFEDVRKRGESVLSVLRNQVRQVRLISRFRHLEPDDIRSN